MHFLFLQISNMLEHTIFLRYNTNNPKALKLLSYVYIFSINTNNKIFVINCNQFQSCPTLCDPKNFSTPGFPVLHYLSELAQMHVHWVHDTIHLSYPLSPPSAPALNLSHHKGLFQWVGSSHQVAKVLELQFQNQFFQWIFRVNFLEDWLVWSLCCPRDSQESSPAP